MEKIIFLFLISLIIVTGCANDLDGEEQVFDTCEIDDDCETPMEYLVQSNCPFGSACISGECRVVCPMSFHDPDMGVSQSYEYPCETDNDCDCSWRTNWTIDCVCHNKICLSVEK